MIISTCLYPPDQQGLSNANASAVIQLVLHSDNGKADERGSPCCNPAKAGCGPSFRRPSVSDDNPTLRAIVQDLEITVQRTLPKRFADIGQAPCLGQRFVNWYNSEGPAQADSASLHRSSVMLVWTGGLSG